MVPNFYYVLNMTVELILTHSNPFYNAFRLASWILSLLMIAMSSEKDRTQISSPKTVNFVILM